MKKRTGNEAARRHGQRRHSYIAVFSCSRLLYPVLIVLPPTDAQTPLQVVVIAIIRVVVLFIVVVAVVME
jgi:hypothetical protein